MTARRPTRAPARAAKPAPPTPTRSRRWWARQRTRLPLTMILVGVLVATAMLVTLGVQLHRLEVVREQTLASADLAAGQRDALAVDVDALREQVQSLGQRPVAPPADTTVQNAAPSSDPPATGGSGVATGPRGPQGSAGSDGRDGVDASAAPSPSPGASGQAGVDGAVGASGAAGADGSPGAAGPVGSAGPAGDDGRGVAAIACQGSGADSLWIVTYTDGATASVSGPCRLDASQQPAEDPEPAGAP